MTHFIIWNLSDQLNFCAFILTFLIFEDKLGDLEIQNDCSLFVPSWPTAFTWRDRNGECQEDQVCSRKLEVLSLRSSCLGCRATWLLFIDGLLMKDPEPIYLLNIIVKAFCEDFRILGKLKEPEDHCPPFLRSPIRTTRPLCALVGFCSLWTPRRIMAP